MTEEKRVKELIKIFDILYPEAESSLEYKDPIQFLVATQLSAQCTDARVNIVSKPLFQRYKNVKDFAMADLEELQTAIRSTGFYRNKAKNIINCCKMLIKEFDGEIPNNMEDMLKLPGVGRKTANLVLGDIFGIPGVVVDTHVKRLSKRMGFTLNDDPEKIEYDLMEIIPQEEWTRFSHQLVLHGRAVCTARNPKCNECPVNGLCPSKL